MQRCDMAERFRSEIMNDLGSEDYSGDDHDDADDLKGSGRFLKVKYTDEGRSYWLDGSYNCGFAVFYAAKSECIAHIRNDSDDNSKS